MSDSDWVDDKHDHEWVDDKPEESGVLHAIGRVGKAIDSYTGAPVRAAVGAAQDTKNPLSAWWNQLGEDPDKAPSGRDIAVKAGASQEPLFKTSIRDLTNKLAIPFDPISNLPKLLPESVQRAEIAPSPAGIAGVGLDIATDPVTYIPPAAFEKGAGLIGKGLGRIGEGLGGAAEKLAVNATGATGAQASKFADDAGRELLDRKLVRFGDSPGNVAKRTQGALDEANAGIDSSLSSLDQKGVTVSADKVVEDLQNKIAQLKKDPSQAGVVKKLQGIVDNIIETGESNVPISQAEQTKRGFNKMAGNWMDPETGQAGKTAYQSYRNAVEGAADVSDAALARKFIESKKAHGLLAPIQEAAERRAATVGQSPFGGLGDMAAAATGGGVGGPAGAAAGVAAKKFVMPRVTSSLAVGADTMSKFLMKSPKMAQLAAENPRAFQALVESVSKRVPEGAQKVAGSNDQPVDDKDARQSFVEGN